MISCDLCGNEIFQRKAKLVYLETGVEARCYRCWTVAPPENQFNPEEWTITFPTPPTPSHTQS